MVATEVYIFNPNVYTLKEVVVKHLLHTNDGRLEERAVALLYPFSLYEFECVRVQLNCVG